MYNDRESPSRRKLPLSTAERIFFAAYVVLGPGVWLLSAYLLRVGRSRMLRLKNSNAVLPADPPLVSVLVPAKDERAHIRTCVDRIFGQTYPAIELIAINDRSTDDTGRALDAAAAAAPRPMRVVHVDALPEGWLGKCHALDAGARHAAGEWLFFVDSDVKLQPDALEKIAALAIERTYHALSIMTAIETHRFVEKLMLPLLAATWAAAFTADQTNEDSEPDKALANGQVFLIQKAAYDAVGGHAAVRDRIVEDVELMRLLKKSGFKTRFFAGRHLASTRMHPRLGQMFHAWARIFAGTARGSVWPLVATIGFLLACVLSVFAAVGMAAAHSGMGGGAFASADARYWLTAAAVHWMVMTVCCGLIWRWSGNSPVFALLLPLSVPIEIAILLFSVRRAIGGNVTWRGAQVALRATSRKAS